jgi:deoxyribonuclease V
MVDISKLKEEQLRLAKKVVISDKIKKFTTIAGSEQAVIKDKTLSGIVVCDNKSLKFVEKKHALADAKIPYISSFLFYREGPAIMEAFSKLETKPDILIIKGNGILHPRRIGMASQIGILLDIATIGVTKGLMAGQVREKTVYIDKEARGYELVTREHSNPIYVSPGHKVSLKASLEIVRKSLRLPHKLPEPLHLAHKYVNMVKKELIGQA